MEVLDLPQPEEVFRVPTLRAKQIVKYAIGPSFIALGASIGSGEWLLGPLNIGQYGFIGVGWVILVSALLQTFYNVESSRYILATGEVPIVGFGRVPPGAVFWLPFSLIVVYFAHIWGGWAATAGQSLFALIAGRVPGDADLPTARLLAVGLLIVVFLITLLSRVVTRGLELFNWVMVVSILVILLVLDIILVPPSIWLDGIAGFFVFTRPPEGISATQLGALAGYTAMASGLNWWLMSHYRDKGYGMGSRVGYIAGLRGKQRELLNVGVTFPDDAKNQGTWRRWYRLLLLDMWGIFFLGAMLGMLLPGILMRRMVQLSGETPTTENVPTFVAGVMQSQYGDFLFYVALLIGTLILFTTQLVVFEALIRTFTDTVNLSPRFHRLIAGDPRRFYYPFMILVLAVVAVLIHLAVPTRLIEISANTANFGALIFPFVIIYLNSKLPRPARPSWYHNVLMLANVVFFGFFFVNFITEITTGQALVQF
ncbi:MAG: hypothetical protein GEV03_17355 [Streptosporangiales bacterium]|nr:hypothetical protein [Streptosporangiales bacterium]